MPYIQPEVLEELKRIDLYTYLKASDPGELQETVLIPMQGDGLDLYRKEINDMLMEKTVGSNGMIRELYVTISVFRKMSRMQETISFVPEMV